jgi:small-conductance mechanosensitive channel
MLYTTILEIDEWVAGDQPTGRLSMIPNSYVLSNITNNYTKDFNFIWDEITIPVTYNSDWIAARAQILDSISQETLSIIQQASDAFPLLERKYFFSKRPTEPAVFVKLTDNWIEISARFVTDPKQRRMIRSKISTRFLESIAKSGNIKIASQTVDIVGFPEADKDACD